MTTDATNSQNGGTAQTHPNNPVSASDAQSAQLEELLAQDGRLLYRGSGVSMRPLIRHGIDLVDIRTDRPIEPYDLALYRRHVRTPEGETTKYVLHRVLADEGDHYLILGDNCITTERVPKEDILGSVDAIIRGGKKLDPDSLSYRLYLRAWVHPWKMRTRILRIKFRLRRGIAKRLFLLFSRFSV